MIYCHLNVALYGTLKAALLFWKKLTKFLIEDGFKVNPYDWCVANKMVDGKQLTIVWHVDDLKISHRDSKVVDIMLDKLDKEYGKVGKMTIRRKAVHDYLGMRFDFSNPGKVMIDMQDISMRYYSMYLIIWEEWPQHQQQSICSRLGLMLSH